MSLCDIACFEVYVHISVPGYIQDSEDLGGHVTYQLFFRISVPVQDKIHFFLTFWQIFTLVKHYQARMCTVNLDLEAERHDKQA